MYMAINYNQIWEESEKDMHKEIHNGLLWMRMDGLRYVTLLWYTILIWTSHSSSNFFNDTIDLVTIVKLLNDKFLLVCNFLFYLFNRIPLDMVSENAQKM